MKPYEEVCFPSGIIRWIREGDEYVCRLSEDQMNEIKEFHEEPWVKTYSGGKPNYTQPIEQEPFEYWNAVEGWVKIDEVRQHFDTAGCGTIYKTAGEDRVPLYTAPQREWQGLTDKEIENCFEMSMFGTCRAIEAKLKEKNT